MTTGNGSSTNASNQGEQKIAISTDTVKWLLGGMATMLLVLIGFAFWLGSLHARIADIDAIKSDLKTHDSRLSALDGRGPTSKRAF